MLDEITLESLTKEQFKCFIEYYRENHLEDYKSNLENLEEIYKMMNDGVEYPRTQNVSPSEIKEPYKPSPMMYSYEQPSCLGSTFVGEARRKSDQLHQTFEKSSIAMTHKLDDMIELPKSQPKRTCNEDLKCEIVMVKMPKCMAWLDDEPIGDLDMIEEKLYLMRRSLEVLRKFHWMILGGRFNQLSSRVQNEKIYNYARNVAMTASHVIGDVIMKDEVPEFVIKFLKMIQVHLNATVCNIRTDNGTEFVNQTLRAYYEEVEISHQTFVARTPQQNGVVKRRNHTLVEAARTIKPDLSYLHVFGALCYPTNDGEYLSKLKPKADIRIFVGYAPAKKAFQIYNKRNRLIIETIDVDFYELTTIAFEQFSSGPRPKLMTPPMFDEYLNPPPCVDPQVPTVITPETVVSTGTPSSNTIDQDAPSTSTSQTNQETPSPVIPLGVEEADHDIEVAHMDNNPYVDFPISEPSSEESSSQVVISNNVHSFNQPPKHINKWTKDHPLNNVIGDPSRSVSTRHQLLDEALFCYFEDFLSFVEPKSYKEALTESCWIEAMQEELNEFEHLEV
ncbi:retrovirus-related pol polyprotein from transposon TNT 1-94 [Tanacetum coccineum]|uniref:Retrovirus-related pol polyprotein from transposon TNT 1-94 n=1 Tax=Tanacetum coccineum TaxID=301880 RepID=A0ABQ4YHZ9_9ASTR